MLPEQIKLLTKEQVPRMNAAQFSAMGPKIAALDINVMASIKPKVMGAISAAAIGSLAKPQVACITPTQAGSMKGEQFNAIGTDKFSVITVEAIAKIMPKQFQKLDPKIIQNLTPPQTQALGPRQLNSMVKTQLDTLKLENLSPKQMMGLELKQIGKMGDKIAGIFKLQADNKKIGKSGPLSGEQIETLQGKVNEYANLMAKINAIQSKPDNTKTIPEKLKDNSFLRENINAMSAQQLQKMDPKQVSRVPKRSIDTEVRNLLFELAKSGYQYKTINSRKLATAVRPIAAPDKPKPDSSKPESPKPDSPKPDLPKPDPAANKYKEMQQNIQDRLVEQYQEKHKAAGRNYTEKQCREAIDKSFNGGMLSPPPRSLFKQKNVIDEALKNLPAEDFKKLGLNNSQAKIAGEYAISDVANNPYNKKASDQDIANAVRNCDPTVKIEDGVQKYLEIKEEYKKDDKKDLYLTDNQIDKIASFKISAAAKGFEDNQIVAAITKPGANIDSNAAIKNTILRQQEEQRRQEAQQAAQKRAEQAEQQRDPNKKSGNKIKPQP